MRPLFKFLNERLAEAFPLQSFSPAKEAGRKITIVAPGLIFELVAQDVEFVGVRHLFISSLVIDLSRRRAGNGQKVLEALIAACQDDHCPFISCTPGSKDGRSFFSASRGFARVPNREADWQLEVP